ncbi:MAG: ATP-binding protein [Myxococcota bacterium]
MFARVAAWILCVVALLVGWQIAWVQRRELADVERSSLERVTNDMSLLQTTLDFALASGAREQVDRELTARGADPGLTALVLLDETGTVVASRLRHEVGLSEAEALADPLPADMMEAARTRQIGQARLSEDGHRVHAIYPVVLGAREGHLRADRIGVVVAVYSLDGARAEVRERLWRRASELIVGAAVGAAFLLLSGQVYIGRRVRRLVAATERFAAGDLHTRAAVGGTDELAAIGAAFDAMAERVGETQRRVADSEARFRTLVEAAPVGILRTDLKGRLLQSNPAWRDIAGGDDRGWPDAVHPDDREAVEREWIEARAAGRTARAACRVVRPDGGVVWIQAQGVVESGPTGAPAGLINTAVDLTERRAAEETRLGLEARLQQAQKLEALGTFAGGVAHDFNNVLAVILGYAELLARAVAGQPAAERHVKHLLRAAERGRALSHQILVFGRPGTRRVRTLEIAPFLHEVARDLRPSLPTDIHLRVNAEAELPALLADPDQLHRVVVNLATNARHAMLPGAGGAPGEGGGVLELGARRVDVDEELARQLPGLSPGPAVLLWVRDEGAGMDAATRAHIFEPFFTTKPHGQGTGLGLAVVHGIVRAHGGAIGVESAPGRGTTVSVYLPTTTPAPAPDDAPPRPLSHPPRILYVDDDEALLELAVHAFQRRDCHVTPSSRPREALARFQADPDAFDLVVTDQRMPGMLGEELVVALRQIRPDVPIVLMSGHVTPADVERILALGASSVVEKPMSIDALIELCHGVLARSGR